MPGPFLNQKPQDVLSRQNFKSSLEVDFKENSCDVFAYTKDEFVNLWIAVQKSYGKTEDEIKSSISDITGLSTTQLSLSFAANYGSAIKDTPSFLALANDFKKSGNILGKYTMSMRNGKEYISFKGNHKLRSIVRGTRYLTSNTQVINIGIGKDGLKSSLRGGFFISVFFSVTLDTINWIFDDNYRWTNWLGTVSTDVVKAVVGIAAGAIIGFTLATLTFPVVLTVGAGFVVGIVVSKKLNQIDEEYKITESIIKALNVIERDVPIIAKNYYKTYIVDGNSVLRSIDLKIKEDIATFSKKVAEIW